MSVPSASQSAQAAGRSYTWQAPDLIFADSFESGSFSAWTSATTDSGDLSVSASAKVAGTFGMQAVVDDNTAIYVTDDTPSAVSRYRARFHLDPNSIAMAEGNAHFIFYGYTGTSTVVLRLELRRNLGDYEIRASYLNDSTGWTYTSWFPIRDQMHYFEIDWQAASGAGTNDGHLTLWIDSVQVSALTGMDNDTRRIDRIRLGPVAGLDTGTRGAYYFDAFESRTTTYIGADPAAPSLDAPAEVVFTDGFETGDFAAWRATATDLGDLSVATSAALVGNYGMQAVIDDNTAIYATDWSAVADPLYQARFYFDPNSIVMASGNAHYILYGYNAASTVVLRMEFRFSSGQYQIRLSAVDDGSTWTNTNWATITDAPHMIEFQWWASGAPGSNSGLIRLWIDGTFIEQQTAIDNDTRRIDYVRLGPVAGIDTGTRGTYYFDAFQARRTTMIGPVGLVPQQTGASRLLFDDFHPSLFTGQLRYAYPISVPLGRAGLAPSITLAYASGVLDGYIGDVQAPWVGAGWNIDAAEIVRNITTSEASYGYEGSYALTFNGMRYDLVSDPSTPGRYHTQEESFLYVQRHNPAIGNAGTVSNSTKEWWEVIARDGTRYRLGWNPDAEQLAFMPGYSCTVGNPCTSPSFPYESMGYAGVGSGVVAMRWRLDKALDRHGNFMTYAYSEETGIVGTVSFDRASYLTTIAYTGHQDAGGAVDLQPAYEVRFVLAPRAGDLPNSGLSLWETIDRSLLDRIDVCYGQCAGGTMVRSYDFEYDVMPLVWPNGTLVLSAIKASSAGFSEAGQTIAAASAPTVRFSYEFFDNMAPGCSGCQQLPYPRLTEIENGYGGTIAYSYENDNPTPDRPFAWRLSQTVTNDGLGISGWRKYTYAGPAYPGGSGLLIGYQTVSETSFETDGSAPILETRHTFGTADPDEGRELQTEWRNSSGTALRRTDYTWTTDNTALPPGVIFRYIQDEDRYERSAGSLTLIGQTQYTRASATGNLTHQEDYSGGTLYRQVDLEYAVNTDPGVWIVDRVSRQLLKTAGGTVEGEQRFYYDGSLTNPPTVGDLTLMQARTGVGNNTADTKYFYDAYGNMIEARAYEGYGTAGVEQSGAYQSTSIGYDSTLHAYATSVTNALGQPTTIGNLLTLGLPYRLTDPNNLITNAAYDGLGRITSTTAPGFVQPTTETTYPVPDSEGQVAAPYSIHTQVWDTLGPGGAAYRSAWTISDGLGRVLQTQASDDAGNLLLGDTAYNAQGLVERQGVPRTVGGTGGTYQTPNWGSIAHTSSTYDPLGRILSLVKPGSEESTYSYDGLVTAAIDANGHTMERTYDAFGRVTAVREYSGVDPSFALYATTTYAYDLADRLTLIGDALNNDTSMGYDWLGRKTTMSDPDAGALIFVYDPLGNLTQQTDARGCTTSVSYDDLNRPTGRTHSGPGVCSSTPSVAYTYDSTANGNLGIGRRTGMTDASGSASWFYSSSGRTVEETRTVTGAPAPYEVTSVTDWMGRLDTLSYPDGEVVDYSYDSLGRPSGLDSSVVNDVASLSYTGAGQLALTTLGNGVVLQNCYRADNLRLDVRRAYPGTVQSCSVEHPSGAAIDFGYSYDQVGNITSMDDAVRAESFAFSYDFLDRLVEAGGIDATSFVYRELRSYNEIGSVTQLSDWNGLRAVAGRYEEGYSGFWYLGTWTTVSDSGASGGEYVASSEADARVRLAFSGGGVKYIRPTGPDRGIADIYIDGALVATVDNYSVTSVQQVVSSYSAGTTGDHLLEIRVTGEKNASSSGTSVDLDAIDVLAYPPMASVGSPHLAAIYPGRSSQADESPTPTPSATSDTPVATAGATETPTPSQPTETPTPPPPTATPTATVVPSVTAPPVPTATTPPPLVAAPSLPEGPPVMFVENVGQFDNRARFQVQASGATIYLAEDGLWITVLDASTYDPDATATPVAPDEDLVKGVNLHVSFLGANISPVVKGDDAIDTRISYIRGADPFSWFSDVPVWGQATYRDILPGLDLQMLGAANSWTWTLVEQDRPPLADDVFGLPADATGLQQVRLRVEGANSLEVKDGVIIADTAIGDITIPVPAFSSLAGGPQGPIVALEAEIEGDEIVLPYSYLAPNDFGAPPTVTPLAAHGAGHVAAVVDRVPALPNSDGGSPADNGARAPLLEPTATAAFSTFLGGSGSDEGWEVAIDSQGDNYFVGATISSDFPTTVGAFRESLSGSFDAFVAKLNPAGTQRVFVSYLGGSAEDAALGVAVGSDSTVYVVGRTLSTDFPTTAGALQPNLVGGSNAFVTRLNASGSSPVYSTYLGGGSEHGFDIAVDSSGQAVVVGQTQSSTFPTTDGAAYETWNGNYDCFVSKLNAAGDDFVFSTYLGGGVTDCEIGGNHREAGVELDEFGAVYVSGPTNSTNFPTDNGYDPVSNGGVDAFLTKLAADGSDVLYSTYIGGPQDDCTVGCDVAVDASGIAYVAGGTSSATGFPVTSEADDPTYNGGIDGFVVRIALDGNPPIYGTYYGGSGQDVVRAVAVQDGRAVVTGWTMSGDLPTAGNPYQGSLSGTRDGFLAILVTDGSDLMYSTYLGGGGDEVSDRVGASPDGDLIASGFTGSGNFPVTSGAYDTSYNGGASDAFVVRFHLAPAPQPTFEPQPQQPDPDHPHAVAEVQRPEGTDTYDYDPTGNMTSRTEAGTTYTQVGDAEGHLVSVTNTSTSDTWTFKYDGDSNRIRSTNPDGTSTLFLAGGLYEVSLDAGGQQAAVKRYYSIAGSRIAVRNASGTYYMLTDQVGSVVSVLDGAGASVYEQRYRPFGQPRLNTSGSPTDFGFGGQRGIVSAGLQDFNARWFDTSLGMFASADPLIPDPFNPQALNRYGYVLNNPLRFVDPTGLYFCEDTVGRCTPPPRPAPVAPRPPATSEPRTPSRRGGVQEDGASAATVHVTNPPQAGGQVPPVSLDPDLGLCINIANIGCSGVPGSELDWMAWNVSMIPYEVRRALRGSDGLLSPLFDATGLALDYAKVHRLAPTGPLTILLDVINQGYSDIGADLNPEQRAGRIAIAVVEGWATGEFASAVGFATAPFGVATVTLAAPEAGPASMAVGYVGGYAVGAIPAMYAANSMFDELNREMVYPFLGLGPP